MKYSDKKFIYTGIVGVYFYTDVLPYVYAQNITGTLTIDVSTNGPFGYKVKNPFAVRLYDYVRLN